MAVSLGPSGLSGDGGGVLVSSGNMSDLGYVGAQTADVDIPLPTGYDFFKVLISFRCAGAGLTRSVVHFQVKNSGGTRLSTETNSWIMRRSGTVTQEYNSASTWSRLGSFVDDVNFNHVEFTVNGKYGSRPGVTWTGNHTFGGVGSSMFIGSTHYNSVTQYRSIGLNADNGSIDLFQYRVIGYPT